MLCFIRIIISDMFLFSTAKYGNQAWKVFPVKSINLLVIWLYPYNILRDINVMM